MRCAFLLVLTAAPPIFGQQVTGSISGSVRDSSGAVLAGASMRLVSAGTGAERSTLADDVGNFVINSILPGTYRLTVQAASSERAASVTGTQVENLLIYGRSVASLVALAPGVVDPTGAAGRDLGGGSATSFNVLGNRSNANNFSVDGVTMSAVGGAANGRQQRRDRYEVRLPAVSRGGMYYKRHEQFNANNFFSNYVGLPRPINRFNTYSYNIGGPIYIPGKFNRNRDKLFFFWNHEYLPRKTASAVQRVTMPSALERTGDFSQSVDVNGKLIPVTDPTSRQRSIFSRCPTS